LIFPQGDELNVLDGKLQADVSIRSDRYLSPVSEVLRVRTQRDFGCVHHEPR
jgi:hypothetical protein